MGGRVPSYVPHAAGTDAVRHGTAETGIVLPRTGACAVWLPAPVAGELCVCVRACFVRVCDDMGTR